MESVVPGRRIVIVAYKPKPGHEQKLLELTKEHVPLLRKLGFATSHPSTVACCADGTLVEVFEWEAGGMEKAHDHPLVVEMWFQYADVCTYAPLNTLAEAGAMFAEFEPVGVI